MVEDSGSVDDLTAIAMGFSGLASSLACAMDTADGVTRSLGNLLGRLAALDSGRGHGLMAIAGGGN